MTPGSSVGARKTLALLRPPDPPDHADPFGRQLHGSTVAVLAAEVGLPGAELVLSIRMQLHQEDRMLFSPSKVLQAEATLVVPLILAGVLEG